MKYLTLFLIQFLFWLALTTSLEPESVIAGILVSLLSTSIFGKHFYTSTPKLLHPMRYLMLAPFLLFFIWECIKASVDVAWRVSHVKLPIKPAIIRIPLSLKSDYARTILSCSLTMTPGTIVVDIEGDYAFIHWIYIDCDNPLEYTQKKINRFERLLKPIFE